MEVHINPGLPLEVLIDFQSVHRAGFRIFVRSGGDWEFVKDGIGDHRIVLPPLPTGSAVMYEFIYFSGPQPFRAVLGFRQNGQILPDGVVPVKAGGDDRFIQGEVNLV
jgi:hypothetical protein